MRLIFDLDNLDAICDVSPRKLASYAEGAAVMLARFDHPTPAAGSWQHDGGAAQAVEVRWSRPCSATIDSYGDLRDEARDGAYAIAMAVADAAGFRVRGRIPQGTGADWWMVPKQGRANDIYKLEVSGIAEKGSPGYILARKKEQGSGGSLDRPGLAVVVRFSNVQIGSESWT